MQVKKWCCLLMALLLLPAFALAEEKFAEGGVAPIAVNNVDGDGVCILKHVDGQYILSGTAEAAGNEIKLRVINYQPKSPTENGVQLGEHDYVTISADGTWEMEVSREDKGIKEYLEAGKPIYLLGRYNQPGTTYKLLCELRFDGDPVPVTPAPTQAMTWEEDDATAEPETTLAITGEPVEDKTMSKEAGDRKGPAISMEYWLKGYVGVANKVYILERPGDIGADIKVESDADGYISCRIEGRITCAPGETLRLMHHDENGEYRLYADLTVPGKKPEKYAFIWLKGVDPIVLGLLLVLFAGATVGLTVWKNIYKRGPKPGRIKEVA